jgi:hypothetical protein
MIDISDNPFAVHSPDALDRVPAQNIVDLFVERYTRISAVKQSKHTFIWGARGSGKSFMLRYLEPQCQFIVNGSPSSFLEGDEAFIGVYTPCKKGEIDKAELDILEDSAAQVITEHLLNLTIAEETVSTLANQFPDEYISQSDAVDYVERITSLFGSGAIAAVEESVSESIEREEQPFKWFQHLVQEEKRRITHYLKNSPFADAKYTGATSGYHDFLLPMMADTQDLLGLENVPMYILLDDAFHLTEKQQRVVNTWIANRDQGTLCVKVSSSHERYETFETVGRGRIEHPHDYTEVNIDEIYTRETGNYAKKVKEIANKRLEISNVSANDIEDFLPKNAFEQKLLEDIQGEMAEEWEDNDISQRKGDYISRYAKARLFQELKQRKNQKSYAGFENIVHISSGRVRGFLDPCYLMFEEVKRGGKAPSEIEEIPTRIQDKILREYSREFLMDEPEKMKKDLSRERRTQLDKLTTLVNSLGEAFYRRLHNPDSREPRIFSFTINGEISDDSELREVLDLGRRMQFFRKSTYSSKEGGGREEWYIMNRRLAPEFKIDPTGFQGRLRLTPEKLRVGCEDPTEFVRLVLGDDEAQEPLDAYFKSNNE